MWKKRDLSETNVCVYDLGCHTPGSTQGHTGKRGRASTLGLSGRRQPGMIGVMLGNSESYGSWKGFLDDLLSRGLKEPMLAVVDGCAGLIRAGHECSLKRICRDALNTRLKMC